MSRDELILILQSHKFVVEKNGIPYSFVDNTLNINNKPVTFFFVEETEKGFYLRTTHPLSASNPLLLLIDSSGHQKRITLIDEYKDKIFCTLISQ